MKHKEPTPDIYKVIYRPGRWKSKCERYYTAFTAQEAMEDFKHTFDHGHVTSDTAKIYIISRYDRFADRWYDVTFTIDSIPEGVYQDKKGHMIFNR